MDELRQLHRAFLLIKVGTHGASVPLSIPVDQKRWCWKSTLSYRAVDGRTATVGFMEHNLI